MDGEINECSCECTAGLNKEAHCKHVCVTLFAVRDMFVKKSMISKKTTTEELQKFHQPAKRYSGSPIKAKNMEVKKLKSSLPFYIDESDSEDDEQYTNFFQNLIKSRGFNNNMALKQLTIPANPYAYWNDHSYFTVDMRYNLLKDLYLINVTLSDVEKIELDTLDQSNNDAWFNYRRVRITASRFYECSKDLNENQSRKLAYSILNPKKFTTKATSHGNMYEKVAIKLFEEHFLQNQLSVINCGLFIIKDYPYIGASPDGLLGEATCIEVKTVYSHRYEILSEKNVDFIYKDDKNCLSLKKNHPHYYQIQGQLMVTGRLYCDLLVYSFKSLLRITVPRDEEFISKMLSKLILFYETYLKPAILNEYLYRDYELIRCQCSDIKFNLTKK